MGERVKLGTPILASDSEVTCEVTISATSGEKTKVETTEMASNPELVAVEGVLSDSLWEEHGDVLETGVTLPAE